MATQSSTFRRRGPCFSNDLPSVTHPHVGSLSLIRKSGNYPLVGKTNVQSSRGDASSGIATIQEHILEEKIEFDRKDGFPSLDDALPWNNEEEDHHVDEEGAPDRCMLLYEELRKLHSIHVASTNSLGRKRFILSCYTFSRS